MIWKTAANLACVALLLCGCGGSTPQSTTPESEANTTDTSGGSSSDTEFERDGDVVIYDPETTEEVIETSEPLD